MAGNRNYSSVARLATTTAAVNSLVGTIPVDQTTGYPSVPFTLVLDPGRSAEEIVTVTAIIGLNLTVTRGTDGTTAQPHDAGAEVRHMATARDFREPAEHINATDGVHGISGGLVGTSDTQTLDNKNFQASTNHVPLKVTAGSGQTANLQDWRDSGGSVLTSVTAAGRVVALGVDAFGSNFTAASAGSVAVVAKAAASQTASVLSVRDSTNAEKVALKADGTVAAGTLTATGNATIGGNVAVTGTLGAAATTVTTLTTSGTATIGGDTAVTGTLSATGRMSSPGLDGSGSTILTSSGASTIPLIVKHASTPSVAALSVRDSANTTKAGVNNSFQLFHGDSTNVLPYRQHAGVVNLNLSGGQNAVESGTVSLGTFDVKPIVSALLEYNDPVAGADYKRVCLTINFLTSTTCTFRIYQASGTILGSTAAYTIHWTAVQMGTGAAAG